MKLLRRTTLLLCAGLMAGLAGCSSAPEPVDGTADTATLTVIVWSAHTNAPVPAMGTLTAKLDGAVSDLDTRRDPTSGCRVTGLTAGAFQVKITRRFDRDSKPQAVDGVEELYLEPGARKEITIVVTDKGGEVGLLLPTSRNTPVASPSSLPLTAARPGGG